MKKKAKASESRKAAIKSLKSEMKHDMMGSMPEELKGKMSVKVTSNSEEGLKEGLEKAEDVLESGKLSAKDLVAKAMECKKSKKNKA